MTVYDATSIEAIASMIEDWGTNNVGMLDPKARAQAERIRALPVSPVPTTGEASEPSPRRVCQTCGATVAAFAEAMCCHCREVPWKITPSPAAIGSDAIGETVEKLRAAIRCVVDGKTDFYRKGNGRVGSIEASDGEKCWIVRFDDMVELEAALPLLTALEQRDTQPSSGES